MAFRSKTTLRSILTRVKPRLPLENKKGVIYCIPCKDCDRVYIGETGRTLSVRQAEHKRHLANSHTQHSAVAAHALDELHDINWGNISVLDHNDDFYKRRIKEALLIRHYSNFNQDCGLAISPVWNSFV